MPYSAPTVQQVKERFPEFEGVEASVVQSALDEAITKVDTSWLERDYQPAAIYYAAHLLTVAGQGSSREARFSGLISAGLNSVKIGSLSLSLFKGGASRDTGGTPGSLRNTSYGRGYLGLLRLNKPAVIVING